MNYPGTIDRGFTVQDGSQKKYEATLATKRWSCGFYFSGHLNDKPPERHNHPRAVKET
jgi:hypothetical protein